MWSFARRLLGGSVAAVVFACSSSSTDPRAKGDGDVSLVDGQGTVAGPTEAGGGATTSSPPPAPAPPVSFVGRFDTSDPAGPKAAWPGTRILARFEGRNASVRLREFAEPWMDGAPSYWEVSIDDGRARPIEMIPDDAPHEIELARNLPDGEHRIELYKRSEAQTGITQFLGFDFHGGRSLPPPERQKRRIEVIGDASGAGFGVEMLNARGSLDCPGPDHAGRWENFRKAWGAHLGTIFDAEVHAIVYSGKGIIENEWPSDTDPLVRYYPRANPDPTIASSAPPFDLTSWVPDVIVLVQGAVDFGRGVDRGAFERAYRDFVIHELRPRSPEAHVFMGVLDRSGRDAIAEIAQGIIDERANAGDHRMHLLLPKRPRSGELVACNGYGSPDYHLRVAHEMAEQIGLATGW